MSVAGPALIPPVCLRAPSQRPTSSRCPLSSQRSLNSAVIVIDGGGQCGRGDQWPTVGTAMGRTRAQPPQLPALTPLFLDLLMFTLAYNRPVCSTGCKPHPRALLPSTVSGLAPSCGPSA